MMSVRVTEEAEMSGQETGETHDRDPHQPDNVNQQQDHVQKSLAYLVVIPQW